MILTQNTIRNINKFGSFWPRSFRGEEVPKIVNDDDDGRQVMARAHTPYSDLHDFQELYIPVACVLSVI